MEIPPGLAARLRHSRHVVVMTGSGVSAESGVPTFRDAQTGLWERFRPEELATPEAFAADPERVWSWYAWRRELVARAKPNAAHAALAALERCVARLTLVTQNVDGLHQRAGSTAPLEFHGNIGRDRCSERCGVVADAVPADPPPPHCPRCGAAVRPDVIWFGEAIDDGVLQASMQAAARCDVFLSVGTSSEIYPAAGLAEIAADAGAMVVEVNPAPTPLSASADLVLRGKAGEVLPVLVDLVRGEP